MRSLPVAIAFGVTSLGMLVSSSNAQAATFNVPGFGEYDITTTQTSYNGDSTLLSSQPWYGSAIEALTFSQTAGSALGTPNSATSPTSSVGPFFSFTSGGAYTYFPKTSLSVTSVGYSPDTTYSFAVATPVPEPSEVLGTLALGFIGLAFKFKLGRLNLNKVN
ncbi:MAG: hypothetical protein JO235_01320 [Chroococcidiopsidaceae cyanobacterium CP_BM_RX_35]|nr:hypothetical protein [Chroococcidiopsidaceae cyanobacterium CP_BM_RX_35]